MFGKPNLYIAVICILIIIIIYIFITNGIVRDELITFITKVPISAQADFEKNGNIVFKENIEDRDIDILIKLHDYKIDDGEYSLHIDRLGNKDKTGEIFNPYGDLSGDLGKINFINGVSNHSIKTKKIRLRGINSIIGRSIIIYRSPKKILDQAIIGYLDY